MGRGLGHAAAGGAAALGRTGSTTAIQNATRGPAAAPSAAAPSAAPTASAHRGHALPRDLNQVGPVAAGVGRGARGFERSTAAVHGTVPQQAGHQPGDRPLSNFERIQQHRLQQAEHLRGIAERNGNDHLLDTADRMEASANQNYQRQTGALPPTAGPTSTPGAAPEVGSETVTVTPAAPAASTAVRGRPTTTPRRGFWFRSR